MVPEEVSRMRTTGPEPSKRLGEETQRPPASQGRAATKANSQILSSNQRPESVTCCGRHSADLHDFRSPHECSHTHSRGADLAADESVNLEAEKFQGIGRRSELVRRPLRCRPCSSRPTQGDRPT